MGKRERDLKEREKQLIKEIKDHTKTVAKAKRAVPEKRNELRIARRDLQHTNSALKALSARIEQVRGKKEAAEKGERRSTTVHALLACHQHDSERVVIVDRDRNAAKNLWHLGRLFLEGAGRPLAFSRQATNH